MTMAAMSMHSGDNGGHEHAQAVTVVVMSMHSGDYGCECTK